MYIKRRWQIRPLILDYRSPGDLDRRFAFVQPPMHAFQCLGHAVSCQRTDIIGPRLLQKLGHIGGRDGVAIEARFKVSVGSRIVTGPQYPLSAISVRWLP